MAWSAPIATPTTQSLQSQPITQLAGSVSKRVVSLAINGGEAVGPSSMFTINLRMSPNGFILPNSMALRCQFDIELNSSNGWAFWGQALNTFGSGGTFDHPSPATSLFRRIDIEFPNGQMMSYDNFALYEFAICINHCLSKEYVRSDLKQLMHCHTIRNAGTQDAPQARRAYLYIPLDLPLFTANSAFPICLMRDVVKLHFHTHSVAEAITNSSAAPPPAGASNFSLSNISLVYTELTMSAALKSELISYISKSPFTMGLKDRLYIGHAPADRSTHMNIQVNLSSVTGVVGTHKRDKPIPNMNTYVSANGLTAWNLYINQQRANPTEIDDDALCYAEFTNAIQSISDPNRSSCLLDVTTSSAGSSRNNYVTHAFGFGYSTAVIDTDFYTLRGIPVQHIGVELQRNVVDPSKWGQFNTMATNTFAYMWALHDTVVMIDGNGDVTLRR